MLDGGVAGANIPVVCLAIEEAMLIWIIFYKLLVHTYSIQP